MKDKSYPDDLAVEGLLEKGVTILMEIRGYTALENHRTEEMVDIIALDPRSEGKALIRIVTAPAKSTVGPAQVRMMEKAVEEGEFNKGILVAQKLSFSAKKTARSKDISKDIEVFSKKTLPSFNIFDHMLVPKHELLSEEKVLKVMRKYRLKPYQLPHVKASDQAIKLLGGKTGDVVKITRKSPTAELAVSYRYVV